MRALVLWSDDRSPNLGVRALARGTAELVDRAFPGAEVELQNFGPGSPAPMPLGNPRSVVKEWALDRRGLKDWLRGFDLVLDTRAGDSFSDIYGTRRLVTMSVVAELVHRCGVPLVLGPQTFGPFGTVASRRLAARAMSTAALSLARDTVSAQQAAALGHPVDLVTTDVVFALPPAAQDRARDVVLNVSGLLWTDSPHVDAAAYRAVLTEVHRALRARGREVTLLAHVLESPVADNDVPAVREFAATVAPEAEVVLPGSLDEVRRVLAGAGLVVGSRMHACLNALSVGTPAVPLAYSRKFEPLLRDLGWDHTVDLRSATPAEAADAVAAASEDDRLATQVKELDLRASGMLAEAVEALRRAV